MTRDPVRAALMVIEEREKKEFGVGEGEGKRVRPLEDVELVGEEAAAKARAERLKREGLEVLEREDKRWDWLLCEFCLFLSPWGRRYESDGWVDGQVLTVNSSDERLGGEGEELEEVQEAQGEVEDPEGCGEAGADGVYGDWVWDLGDRRWSRRGMIDEFEAFLGLGSGFGETIGLGGMTRLVYNTGFGIHTCGLYDGVGICYQGWDGSDGCTLVGSRAGICMYVLCKTRPESVFRAGLSVSTTRFLRSAEYIFNHS